MTSYKTSAFVCVALSAMAISVILPILAPISRVLQLSEIQVGLIVSTGSIAMAAAGMFWGRISDRIGRQPVMMMGFIGLGLSYVIYTYLTWLGLKGALAPGALFTALLISRAVTGIFLPAAPAAAQALVADNTTDDERSAGMALIGAANGLGMVVGPVIGGVLALYSLMLPFVITTIICFMAFLFITFRVPRTPLVERGPTARIGLGYNGIWRWLVTGFLVFLAIITMQVAAAFYVQDSLGITEEQTAPILAVGLFCVGVLMIVTQILQMKVLRWTPRSLALAGATLWIIGLAMLLSFETAYAYYAAYCVLGVGNGLIFPGVMAGASLCVDGQHQGSVAGMIATVQGLAAIVTPIGSTVLYHFRPELPFLLVIGCMTLILLIFSTSRSAAVKT